MVNESCLADPRRRSEVNNYLGTVPQAAAQLRDHGIYISVSSLKRYFISFI